MKMKKLKLLIALMFPVLAFAQSGGTDNFQSKPNYVEIDSLKENSAGTYKFVVWNEITSLLEYVNGTDQTESNEGSLTVLSGGANSSYIHSNTTGSTDVVINGGDNITVTESGNTINISTSGGGFSGASISNSGTITLGTALNSYTMYAIGAVENYDTDNYHSPGANSFTIPADGYYRLSFSCRYSLPYHYSYYQVMAMIRDYSNSITFRYGESHGYYSETQSPILQIQPVVVYLTSGTIVTVMLAKYVSTTVYVDYGQGVSSIFEIQKL